MQKIRIIIVDDHPAVRRGLALAFRAFDRLELVGEAVGGVEAVDLCKRLHPDVALMDLMMPEMDGVTATRLIRVHSPNSRVIVLTASRDDTMIDDALRAGAVSYLLKSASLDQVAEAIFASVDAGFR